jgi:hypothetical protein
MDERWRTGGWRRKRGLSVKNLRHRPAHGTVPLTVLFKLLSHLGSSGLHQPRPAGQPR